MVLIAQNPVTDSIGAGARSQNQATVEEFILEYLEYSKPHRKRISLDANALRKSLVEYVYRDVNLFSTWEDNEQCGCWATDSYLVDIKSLIQITREGVELVFSEEISLPKLFSSDDWQDIFSKEVHDKCADHWYEHSCEHNEDEYDDEP